MLYETAYRCFNDLHPVDFPGWRLGNEFSVHARTGLEMRIPFRLVTDVIGWINLLVISQTERLELINHPKREDTAVPNG